jgi:hypothetical protein
MSSGLYTQSQFPSPQQPQQPPFGPQTAAPQYAEQRPAPSSGKFWLGLLMIGGGIALLCSVLVVAAVWYAVASLEGMLVGLGREAMVAMVQESSIPAGEQQEVIAQIDRVVAAHKVGEIDQADLDALLTKLDDSPVMVYIAMYGGDDYYIEQLQLAPADEDRVRAAYRRALYAVSYCNADEDEFFMALPDDELFDQQLADNPDEAKALLMASVEKFHDLADKANVPVVPPAIDIGDEAKKLVDEMLTR